MSSNTKIVVLHMKEVIYTCVFLALAILFGIILFIMFGSKKDTSLSQAIQDRYTPGIYTTTITLNENTFDVAVTVDSDHINSIKLENLSETTTAMYPLMEPVLTDLASQICTTQSTKDLTYSQESKYTSLLLVEAIDDALSKAAIDEGE